ncbi:hypothetical protein [Rhodohalobacter barkolensis]|uniref:Uncharacterized protein n=1 Tax=Rhodohalobacter barkolensis TaxID=2053187 RepID=A0A2N0VLU9_9BACT|nr:hypothetical protein [Rhodohalobacter barkolensis]PKD45121.1 hypothetical protein CWD77_06620 [Rhodohalobacter barkolensis]
MIENLAIGLVLGLIGIGVLGILVSGIKNVVNGKSDIKRVGAMGVPVVVFVISYATLGSANQAGVATMMFMIVAMILGIVVTGTRGTFKF